MQIFLNNFRATFLAPIPSGFGEREIRVSRSAAGPMDAELEEDGYYLITAYRIVDGREVEHEVMRVTHVVVDNPGEYRMTVQRAHELAGASTTIQTFAYQTGDHLEMRWTAAAAQNLMQAVDAGETGKALLKAPSPDIARQILGVGVGGGEVDVAENGALVAGGATVAPAYLGVRTAMQITAIHAAIAAGTTSYPIGSTLITEAGEVMTLRGVGAAARFTISTPSEVDVSPIRTGNFSVTQADSGTSIPVSGTASTTLNTGLTGFICAFQREDTATFTLTAGSGVTFRRIVGGVSTVVSSITATQQGQYVLVRPAAAANQYYVSVGG